MQVLKSLQTIRGILILALVLRIIAAIFSKGYAFHDDHFCVLRVAESWTEGIGHWVESPEPPKHSMLYAFINTVLLWVIKVAGVTSPVVKAMFLQLFHGIYSLLIVWLGYRITLRISTFKNAILVAQILAVLWFMPYLGVKFMAEIVCLPPLMYAFLLYLDTEGRRPWKWIFIGLMLALAFSIRMHTILIAGGIGLALLFRKEYKPILLIVSGFLVTTFVTIALFDILFFNYPYEYILNYFAYNSQNAYEYVTGSPFKFLGTTLGFLVPPVSLMLIWGYARSFKIDRAMFMGVLLFFLVHSIFPNKQERFILPMFPFLIILGAVGWENFVQQSAFWQKNVSLRRGAWNFFWVINIIAGLFMGLNYTKKDRVAPLNYLSSRQDVEAVLLEGTQGGTRQTPVYYLGEGAIDYNQFDHDLIGYREFWSRPDQLPASARISYTLDRTKSSDSVKAEFERMGRYPNYVVFYRSDSLSSRLENVKELLNAERLEPVAEFEPSSLDKLLNFFNPRIHKRNDTQVYRVVNDQQP